MQVFDFQIPDEDITTALTRIYRTELLLLKCDFEFHSRKVGQRLALANILVGTHEGDRPLGMLVKEGSEKELVILSLMNKLLPYSSPRVIYYVKTVSTWWLLLENIPTWVDISGRHRVNDLLVDGLYDIQAPFFGNIQPLLDNFKTFPASSGERLLKTGLTALADVNDMCSNGLFTETFEQYPWSTIQEAIQEIMSVATSANFPTTIVHGNYYPNTARAIRDPRGDVHVVVYDWQNASIGWPQIDLALLLDRLDVLASFQGLSKPSPVLLQRYLSMLVEKFGTDTDTFYEVYNACYLCRVLPLLRWWMKGHIKYPEHNPDRVLLELHTKLKTVVGVCEGEG